MNTRLALLAVGAIALLGLAGCGPDTSKDQTVDLGGMKVAIYPGAETIPSPSPPPGKGGVTPPLRMVSADPLDKVGRFYISRYGSGAKIQGDAKLVSISSRHGDNGLLIAVSARNDKKTDITLSVTPIPPEG